jgi:capsid protein
VTLWVPSDFAAKRSSRPAAVQFTSAPAWGNQRYFENAETTRLNQAHWERADDVTVNVWLATQLPILRRRAIYEHRQNPTVQGVVATHADDIVGQDGPTLQVLSESADYNEALEQVWREWFAAPTTRRNVSGAALLKLWVRSLWKCGEYIARIVTDETADGPISMRLRPRHPRDLVSPAEFAADENVCCGIRFSPTTSAPTQYYLARSTVSGQRFTSITEVETIPPDLILHEFLLDEEDQARGIPWLNSSLAASSELRDYDDQIQDAARQMADQAQMLYTEHPDAPYWANPESMTVERRTVKMAPPGWKPAVYPATQPPVQYPDYRAEKHRDIGRPVGMPLLLVRMDASKHSWASARIDTTSYARAIAGVQYWLSGSEYSTGTLNRLVDLVATEGRFTVRELRNRPDVVTYHWTWPQVPIPQPEVEENANTAALQSGTQTLTEILTKRKKTLETHIEERRREIEAFEAAGIPVPSWAAGATQTNVSDSADVPNKGKAEKTEEAEEPANA